MTQQPLDLVYARSERDADTLLAILLVGGNAGATWTEAAFHVLCTFAQSATEFMTEDARAYSVRCGLLPPHDNRAWGAVTARAIREGVIKKSGYAPSKTGHMRPMPVWESLVQQESEQ